MTRIVPAAEPHTSPRFSPRPAAPSGLPRLVGVAGWADAGKDAVGQVLVDEYGYQLASTGMHVAAVICETDMVVNLGNGYLPLARQVFEDLGYEDAKKHAPVRLLMQDLGEAIKKRMPGFWIDTALAAADPDARLVVVGVRSVGEADAILALGGAMLRVNRPGTAPANDHVNERQLDDYDRWTAVIDNDGTLEDLADRVRELCTPTAAVWGHYRRTGEVTAERRAAAWTWVTERGDVLTAAAGDWHVTDGSGRSWSVTQDRFEDLYEPTGPGRWRRTGVVLAQRISAGQVVQTPEGPVTTVDGDWLVQAPGGGCWPVSSAHFAVCYAPLAQAA